MAEHIWLSRQLPQHLSRTCREDLGLGDPTFQINMVRLKNRYLLVNILYPESTALPSSKVPDVVAFNQPTTDDLTPQLLIKAIREAVLELFGDYGSGAIAGSLMGEICRPIAPMRIPNSKQLNIYRLPLRRLLYELRGRITELHGRPCR